MRVLRSNILKESIKEKLLTIFSFYLDFFPQLILTTRSWDIAKIELMIFGPYLCMWKPSDVVPGHFQNLKMEQKAKVAQNIGFFLRFFSWLISTTRSRNTASMHPILMGLYFSKMVVEFAFLDLLTSQMSQIVTHSSDYGIVFVQILNPNLSSSKNVIILAFSQKIPIFGRLTHGTSHWNIFPICTSNLSCNKT